MKSRNFKSKTSYKRWLAFGHKHGVFKKGSTTKVTINGVPHKVKHK